jgi:hypothetical protein
MVVELSETINPSSDVSYFPTIPAFETGVGGLTCRGQPRESGGKR